MLAIETGIAPSAWWAEDEADLATALDVMDKERERQERETAKANRGRHDDEQGRVMGGGG
jgi:hypothetical protein